ncbi:MAG: xanthine dehydrogenase family protein molybdopterin-binding subunit [Planctomycetes bacterium]|nr:xanthine dehydrogenase family protein molybdopterin-binding subunit [Planctomycetota bacterium]
MKPDPIELTLGYAGAEKQVKVEVPAGDAPHWDLRTRFTQVGGEHDRVDAVAKVTGRARYTYDITLPGLLLGTLARSPHPRGKLVALDLSGVAAMPGVRAVIPLKEIGHQVRFVGDPIAAIAADTLHAAKDALAKLTAQYELTPDAPIDLRDADGAPTLDDAGNVSSPWPAKGNEDIEQALAGAAHVAEGTWSVEVQTHSSLESHGAVSRWNDDGSVDVWCSTQATFGVRQGLAEAAGVPVDKLRVHAEYVGGGFGSKFVPGTEALAAVLLAREAKAPVKLMLDRYEEHTCTGNRPSALMRIRAGVDAAGKLVAFDWQSFGGPGFSGSGGRAVHVRSWFGNAKTRAEHVDLTTFTDAARAMRAPGWPQGNFAAEGMLDELAAKAGMDPLAFRLLNDGDELRQHEWRLGAERFGWQERVNPKPGSARDGESPRYLRGAGCAAATWGQLGGTGNSVLCRLHQDGTIEVRNGAQDIGTGMKTVLALLMAEDFGVPTSRVKVTMGHTTDPVGPASGGSTTTPSLAPTARHAAQLAKQELLERVAAKLGMAPAELRYESGKVLAGERSLSFEEACRAIGPNPIEAMGRRFRNGEGYRDSVAGCQFAEVRVDTATGAVAVTKMLAVQDCGLVIAKKLAESQVIGAMIQGISYALHEQRIMDRRLGRMMNGDLSWYKIAGPRDVPPMEAILFSVANGKNNTGAAGLGEPPSVAAPAAVANAVSNAIGVRMRSLPITPDKVLAALASRRGKQEGR